MGQRTRKVTDSETTTYHYDLNGKLITETTDIWGTSSDYIYMGSTPIAQINIGLTHETVNYLHTDHLGTPRRATDNSGNLIWMWESEGFGQAVANEDPMNSGISTTMNLRFAGQYFDRETQLHYNYFRYYDPSSGRYITSDPIGLDGGLNTFGYVDGNPLNLTDPTGENPKLYATASFCVGLAIGDAINNAYPPDQYLRDALESINNNIDDLESACPMDSRGNRTRDLIDEYKRARQELIAKLSSNQGNTLLNTFIQNFGCTAAISGFKLFP